MQRVALSGYYPGRPDDNVWDKYLLALYYVMSTFTTNGLVEELNPSTYVEAGFATLLMLLNMTMFAYIIGEISSLIMEGDNEVRNPLPCSCCPVASAHDGQCITPRLPACQGSEETGSG